MKELTKSQKLNFIRDKAQKYDLTAGIIAKSTDLKERGIRNILTGHTQNPHLSTLNQLYTYLENLDKLKDGKNAEHEAQTTYPNGEIGADDIIARKVLQQLLPHLDKLKEQNEAILRLLYEAARHSEAIDIDFQKFKSGQFQELAKQLEEMHDVITSKSS